MTAMRVAALSIPLFLGLASCQGKDTAAQLLPVGFRLLQEDAVGRVRRIELQIIYPAVHDPIVNIREYNHAGIMTRFAIARRVNGQLEEDNFSQYTFNARGGLVAEDHSGDGNVVAHIEYEYRNMGGATRIVPKPTKSGDSLDASTYTERHTTEGWEVKLGLTDRPDPDYTWIFAKAELRETTSVNILNGHRTTIRYHMGKIASSTVTHPEESEPTETVYSYSGGSAWPKSSISTKSGTIVATQMYEYELDSSGNWLDRKTYKAQPGGVPQLTLEERRTITYYTD